MFIKIITLNKDVPVTTIFDSDKVVATTYNAESNNYTVKFSGGNLIILELNQVGLLEWTASKRQWNSVEIAEDYDSQNFAAELDNIIWFNNPPSDIGA